MSCDNLRGDAETKAKVVFVTSGLVSAIKTLEYMFFFVVWDANAIV